MSGVKQAPAANSSAIRRAPDTPAPLQTLEPETRKVPIDGSASLLEQPPAWASADPRTSGLTAGPSSIPCSGLLGFLRGEDGAISDSAAPAAAAAPAPARTPARRPATVETSKGWAELKPEDRTLLSQMLTSREPLAIGQKAALRRVLADAEWDEMTPAQQKDELQAKLKPYKTLRGMQNSKAWAVLDDQTRQQLIRSLTLPAKAKNADILSRLVVTDGYARRDAKAQAGLLVQEHGRTPDSTKVTDRGPTAALSRLKQQPAAADIDARTSTRLHLLLTGKMNPYAKEARIELERRAHDPVYAVMTRAEQTKYLAEIASGKTVAPYLVSTLEVPKRTPLACELGSAVARDDFRFVGATQDASQRDLKIHGRTIPIYTAAGAAIPGQNTPEEVAHALALLPASALRKVKRVVLNPVRNPGDAYWAKIFNKKDFRAAMTASADGSVNIFPAAKNKKSQDVVTGTIAHEAGHLLAYEAFGSQVGGSGWQRYQQAVEKDGVAPSGYGTGNLNEDFAESLQLYLMHRESPEFAELRGLFPARFAVVEDVLAGRISWTPPPTPRPTTTTARPQR